MVKWSLQIDEKYIIQIKKLFAKTYQSGQQEMQFLAKWVTNWFKVKNCFILMFKKLIFKTIKLYRKLISQHGLKYFFYMKNIKINIWNLTLKRIVHLVHTWPREKYSIWTYKISIINRGLQSVKIGISNQ